MNTKRLFFLDAARGFALVLVILGHIWETDRLIPVLIYSFHVPMFFIISGILMRYTALEERPPAQTVRRRFCSLIVPYLFYELVFVVVFGLRNGFDYGSAHVWDGLLLQPLNVPLWFLPTLFLAELALLALLRLTHNRQAAGAVCLLLYTVPFFVPGGSPALAVTMRCLCALGFVALGYFGCDFAVSREIPAILSIAALIAGGLLAVWNGKVGIYKLTFHNPLLFTVCAAMLSFAFLSLFRRFRLRPLEWIGTNSLPILGLHLIVLRILQQIFGLGTDSIPGGLAALALILALLAPVCLAIRRVKCRLRRAHP